MRPPAFILRACIKVLTVAMSLTLSISGQAMQAQDKYQSDPSLYKNEANTNEELPEWLKLAFEEPIREHVSFARQDDENTDDSSSSSDDDQIYSCDAEVLNIINCLDDTNENSNNSISSSSDDEELAQDNKNDNSCPSYSEEEKYPEEEAYKFPTNFSQLIAPNKALIQPQVKERRIKNWRKIATRSLPWNWNKK